MSQKRAEGLTVAIEGCCHGELDRIYGTIQHMEKVRGIKVDLLLICGDFQAVRNLSDLEEMACPPKYRALHDFYHYYKGSKQTPIPTLFIGGNHEATGHLQELCYGGWAAPGIFYTGWAGVVKFGGLRIGGLSGIYKEGDFLKGRFERPPFTESTKRSAYRIRQLDVWRLSLLQQPLDVMMSHDWPLGIADHGNAPQLFQRKKHLRVDHERSELGSPPAMQLLRKLKPRYWFSAHLHCKFAALVDHGRSHAPTKFLALDKPLPGRDFLQVLNFPKARGPRKFQYDEEWLAILRATHPFLSSQVRPAALPLAAAPSEVVRNSDRDFIRESLRQEGEDIPLNFVMTAAPHNHKGPPVAAPAQNPQTVTLLQRIGCTAAPAAPPLPAVPGSAAAARVANPEEIDLDNEDSSDDASEENDGGMFESLEIHNYDTAAAVEAAQVVERRRRMAKAANPEEIELDDED